MTEDEEKYMSECLDEWAMIDDPMSVTKRWKNGIRMKYNPHAMMNKG